MLSTRLEDIPSLSQLSLAIHENTLLVFGGLRVLPQSLDFSSAEVHKSQLGSQIDPSLLAEYEQEIQRLKHNLSAQTLSHTEKDAVINSQQQTIESLQTDLAQL